MSLCLLCITGINVVSNMTCEENELTPDDYIKIIWTSAAELPGVASLHDAILLKLVICISSAKSLIVLYMYNYHINVCYCGKILIVSLACYNRS